MLVGNKLNQWLNKSAQGVTAPKDQQRTSQNFQIKDVQENHRKGLEMETFGKGNLWIESRASSHGLNNFQES